MNTDNALRIAIPKSEGLPLARGTKVYFNEEEIPFVEIIEIAELSHDSIVRAKITVPVTIDDFEADGFFSEKTFLDSAKLLGYNVSKIGDEEQEQGVFLSWAMKVVNLLVGIKALLPYGKG